MNDRWDLGIRHLAPGYFAAVMATGIVGVALRQHGSRLGFDTSVIVAAGLYVILIVLNLVRLRRFGWAHRADAVDPRRAFGYFTVSAASTVLGTCVTLTGHVTASFVLFAVGLVTWFATSAALPGAIRSHRGPVAWLPAANGSWFIWTVATEGIAVQAAALEPHAARCRQALVALGLGTWGIGIVLYVGILAAVVARIVRHGVSPAQLTAAYWVTMGATAIIVVAGAQLHGMVEAAGPATVALPIVRISVGFWIYATVLIPLLVGAGVWRHAVRRHPLRYEADGSLWAMVFPLGMYAVAGMSIGRIADNAVIEQTGRSWTWVAVAAWGIVAAAFVFDQVRRHHPVPPLSGHAPGVREAR